MQNKNSEIIVIGSGIAGLSFAINIAKRIPDCTINVITKSEVALSNSNFAQGGIAVVTNLVKDSYEAHIQDTLASGGGLSKPSIVKLVVETAYDRLKELVEYGVEFNHTPNGEFDLALEGGHSQHRVVHAFDNTGEHVVKSLILKAKSIPNIQFFENRFCIDLLKNTEGAVKGTSVLNLQTKEIEIYKAKLVILASGGSGQVYKHTTNPDVATGDGVAMGMKLGALVANLNFIQFHPTALYEENKPRLDLLTEAIRGFGAYIRNKEGKRFVFDYDPRGELATRDIVSKAIFSELRKSGDACVYLDCKHLNTKDFNEKFPQTTKNLHSKNIDITKDLIPIVPAAHYQCGGLKVDEVGQTTVKGLFAIGECAETGLHGVNRLASNSLLEGLVFAHESAEYIAKHYSDYSNASTVEIPNYQLEESNDAQFIKEINQLRNTMTKFATISSSLEDLDTAIEALNDINKQVELLNNDNQISEQRLIFNNLLVNALAITKFKRLHFLNTNKNHTFEKH
ncbi:MAG: L-aspartate oxidase [Crocinitomicaceae bacterium]|nr:L-aspartate oxidase [Crocinitomicaceae bacterium]